jgi:hypothetical protein
VTSLRVSPYLLSPNNNAVFKHYYNVDVSGGFNANTRTDAFIEVNNNVLRSGVVELEGVQLKNLQPHAYKVVSTARPQR